MVEADADQSPVAAAAAEGAAAAAAGRTASEEQLLVLPDGGIVHLPASVTRLLLRIRCATYVSVCVINEVCMCCIELCLTFTQSVLVGAAYSLCCEHEQRHCHMHQEQ
jgi:hypothetical protein